MKGPLKDRLNGEWTVFEGALFNLFTREGPHKQELNSDLHLLFSKRLRVVQAMLDAMEAEIAVIRAEREANL